MPISYRSPMRELCQRLTLNLNNSAFLFFQVEFNINQVKRNKEFIAVDVQVVQASQSNGIKHNITRNNGQIYQGFIAALKDGFGFIETIQHDKEVFFHFR